MKMAAVPSCDLVAVRHKSGAKARAVQTLTRSSVRPGQRDASGLRAIYRRCFPPTSHLIHCQNPVRGFVNFGFRVKCSVFIRG